MNKEFLFITFDENKELKFVSLYSSLDDVFSEHRFKVPLHILKRVGYAKNRSNDGSGCFLFYLGYDFDHLTIKLDNVMRNKITNLLKSALREVKLNELGI